ncbi:hypothetical protein D3C77_444000 [compost metagenome]
MLREREIRTFVVIVHFSERLNFLTPDGHSTWNADWQPVPDFATKDQPYIQDSNLTQLVAATRNVVVESCEDRKAELRAPTDPLRNRC